jgi:ferredoxin-thioredoxin reductase catalytic subunit
MITPEKVRRRAESDAKARGYYLNPDPDFLRDLLEGLKRNEERYGYPSCPCRLASGVFELDRDITCPCDYRDPDTEEYGHYYCALYVRKAVFEGKESVSKIPERRPSEKLRRVDRIIPEESPTQNQQSPRPPKMVLWYCRQCGYVCFREDPPYVCPICRAKREMFSQVELGPELQG